ncbi:hypothetical protein [Campylobacter cuniculorum]|uniref:Uncharacterized protein n=1 Tax=Campylobacter cuniculorum TaxID=374106 RepID=A0ABX6TZC3_9BACT|nr:hypothetical protein [Campylobacter cuniculorum]QOR05127.1 hypothetical protein A0071_04140 [Campylobacter cuniculorum]
MNALKTDFNTTKTNLAKTIKFNGEAAALEAMNAVKTQWTGAYKTATQAVKVSDITNLITYFVTQTTNIQNKYK